jgi:hypothetical protein
MSPVAAANLASPTLSSGVTAPAELVGQGTVQIQEWTVSASEAEPVPSVTRVKQMHPADLALLTNAARSIRLRGH